jgi:hypothetical protein
MTLYIHPTATKYRCKFDEHIEGRIDPMATKKATKKAAKKGGKKK